MELSRDFQRRKDFLSLTPQDEKVLRDLQALLGTDAPGFVESFYDHLMSFAETRALIPNQETLVRLKKAQTRYFQTLVAGVYDRSYLEDRLRVGLAHAKVGLSPGWYLGAYSHYLTELLPTVSRRMVDQGIDPMETFRALVKVVFLDVGLAIDSYITHRDELIASLRDYGAAFANLPYGTLVATADLEVVFANHAFEGLFGFAPNSLRGCPLQNVMDVGSLPFLIEDALNLRSVKTPIELRSFKNPRAVPVNITVHKLPLHEGGQEQRLLLVFEDLREQAQLTRDLFNAQSVANIGTWHSDFEGYFYMTPQAARLLGWPEGKPCTYDDFLQCIHPEDQAFVDVQWREALQAGQYKIDCRVRDVSRTRWLELRGKIEKNANGIPVRGYGTLFDITERKLAQHMMERLAFFDTLTGLPNRTHGMVLAQQLLDQAQQESRSVAVLFIDLDRFKEINDTQGHVVGDQVLANIAQHCRGLQRDNDVFARVGGDEFIFVRALKSDEAPLDFSRAIHQRLATPLTVEGLQFEVGASIGVAVFPGHGRDMQELLQHADIAMYQVKAVGGGSQMYTDAIGAQLQRRIAVGTRLMHALESSTLLQYYQPKVNLRTGQLQGVEALARWHDPEWGWVSPGEFIPIAEERGLISVIGDWSLSHAAAQLHQWQAAGIQNLPQIAINVSGVQMLDESFPERAQRVLQMQGIAPAMIELEITESSLMNDPAKAQRVATALVDAGFKLSIDDFGTGYSSLARLQTFPVSKLKIDMSFVRQMLHHGGNRAIVTAVIGMARALQLETVAEGVETEAQADLLRQLSCDQAQGYLYAKAMSADDLVRDWLSACL